MIAKRFLALGTLSHLPSLGSCPTAATQNLPPGPIARLLICPCIGILSKASIPDCFSSVIIWCNKGYIKNKQRLVQIRFQLVEKPYLPQSQVTIIRASCQHITHTYSIAAHDTSRHSTSTAMSSRNISNRALLLLSP